MITSTVNQKGVNIIEEKEIRKKNKKGEIVMQENELLEFMVEEVGQRLDRLKYEAR